LKEEQMNDRMKESLSALVDGQADELEIRRVLNASENDQEMREAWGRYQMMGALMRDEPVASVDLSKGIMQAISGEPMDEVPAHQELADPQYEKQVAGASYRNWIASGAVAASVAVAVLLGVRVGDGVDTVSGSASVAAVEDSVPSVNTAEPIQPFSEGKSYVAASSGSGQLASFDGQTSIAVDEETLREAQQRLQDYVMQHNEQSALNGGGSLIPYVRVTSFEQGGEGDQ
jgi:sigma-E factor negative regulatory protein RseA